MMRRVMRVDKMAHISCPPVLRLPDFSQVFVLQTDACNDGIGGILTISRCNIWARHNSEIVD